MKLINWIRLYWGNLRKQVEKFPITNYSIKDYLKSKFDSIQHIEVVDGLYMTCDYDDIKKVVSLMPIRRQKYIKEEMDCDNFTEEFRVLIRKIFPRLPVGICHVKTIGGLHALNFILYRTKGGNIGYTYIEPQSNKISYFNYKPYFFYI